MSEIQQRFEAWALVELFGRSKIAGKVTEATLAGGAFIRVDVPATAGNPAFTRFFRPEAIYSISPTTEAIVRAMVSECAAEPVHAYDLPRIAEHAQDNGEPGARAVTGKVLVCPTCSEAVDELFDVPWTDQLICRNCRLAHEQRDTGRPVYEDQELNQELDSSCGE